MSSSATVVTIFIDVVSSAWSTAITRGFSSAWAACASFSNSAARSADMPAGSIVTTHWSVTFSGPQSMSSAFVSASARARPMAPLPSDSADATASASVLKADDRSVARLNMPAAAWWAAPSQPLVWGIRSIRSSRFLTAW